MRFNFPLEQSYGKGLIEAFAKQATRHEAQIVDFGEYYEDHRHILVGPKKEQFYGVGRNANGDTVIRLYNTKREQHKVLPLSDFNQKDLSRIALEVDCIVRGLQKEALIACFDVYEHPEMPGYEIVDIIYVFNHFGRDRDFLYASMFAHGAKYIKGTELVINGKKYTLVDQFCVPVPPSKIMGYVVRDKETGNEAKIPIDIFPVDQAKVLADKLRETNLF